MANTESKNIAAIVLGSVMKSLINFLRLTLCLLLVCAMLPVSWAAADSAVDDKLVLSCWQMTVGNFANITYMNFYRDNTGIMELPVHYQSPTESYDTFWCYDFTWYTHENSPYTYITIIFEGEFPGYGWGVNQAPYQMNTYKVLWNDEMIIFNDWMHVTGSPEDSELVKNIKLVKPDYTTHSF